MQQHVRHSHRDTVAVADNVQIIVHNHRTGRDQIITTHNLVTEGGLDVIGGLLAGASNAQPLTHLSVGTGTNPPAVTDTGLQLQVFIGPLTRTGRGARPGEMIAEYYLQRVQANGHDKLTEIGLWSDGVLYARALIPGGIPKSKDYSVTFIWTTQLGVA